MNKDELIAEIEVLRQIVAMGHDRLTEEQYLDMELMQSKVDAACQELAELTPQEAAEVRQSLTDLLESLQKYSSSVQEHVSRDASSGESGGGQG